MTFRLNPHWLVALFCIAIGAFAAETNSNRKALVIGRGDPFQDHGGPTHAQSAKNLFLRFVGNPSNDPAKGWTCDMSWDLMKRLGMDPAKSTLEDLFGRLRDEPQGYRIVIQNGANGSSLRIWGAAIDAGMMPFAPHGDNTPNKRVADSIGLKACVSVGGGISSAQTTYGPGLELFDAVPSHMGFGEDIAQSWANQMVAAKFAKILDRHPEYNIWDARQHLRQAASHWGEGWTERNGYGRVNLNAPVDKLLPGPPVDFQATLSRNARQVHFSWRNFAMTDFAATVIARKDGRIIYEGTGTNFTWTTDSNVPTAFVYWSKSRSGEKSRLETYQERTIAGLSYHGMPSCLILAEPGLTSAGAIEMMEVFTTIATNWVCDMACRTASKPADWVGGGRVNSPYVVVLSDYSAMLEYALSNRYQIILVAGDEKAASRLGDYEPLWHRALAAGSTVVLPHSGLWPQSTAEAHMPSPSQLGSAITVAYCRESSALTFGPGLEFIDAPENPPNYINRYVDSANAAAASVAGKIALVFNSQSAFNNFDARQCLRQGATLYGEGWCEQRGFGRPSLKVVHMDSLDLAPPLNIRGQRTGDGRSVVFSWLNYEQVDFAATVIEKNDGSPIYTGRGTNFVWMSDVEGEMAFRFRSKGRSGRYSRDETYTLVRIDGLTKW